MDRSIRGAEVAVVLEAGTPVILPAGPGLRCGGEWHRWWRLGDQQDNESIETRPRAAAARLHFAV